MNQTDRITPSLEGAPAQEDFVAFIVQHFDAAFYLQAYPDVATSKTVPLQHWLKSGLAEGRQISRYVVVRHGDVACRSSSRIWRHFRWSGHNIAVRLIDPLPPDVMTQIANQARHDTAVLAAGADTVAELSQQDRENVHLDVAGLRRSLPRSPEFLLVVPDLGAGAALRFTVDLALILGSMGSIQVIVAEQDAAAVPEPWRSIDILFWQDYWIHGPESVNLGQLAQLISVVRPRATIVADSRRGYTMVARYGRALSERTNLYCLGTAETEGNDIESLLLQTLPFATALTDDVARAERLRQHGNRPTHGVVTLPSHSVPGFRDAVASMFARS